MPSDVRINIITTQEGQQNIGQAADALNGLGKAGQQSADGLDKTTGGLGGLVKGAADAYGAFNILTGALKQGGGLIQGFYDAGVASERFTAGLNALSGGKADQYITSMSTATHGLISNTTLARDAALALSTGIAKSSDEASKLAGMGATLGLVFQNDAAGGVDAFFRAFEHPGQTRPLAALGYDIAAVKDEMAKLKKEGMDLSDAWNKTLLDQSPAKGLGDALDGAGTAVDRVNTKLDNLKAWSGTRIAIGIDATLNLMDAVGNKIITQMALDQSGGHVVTPGQQAGFDAQNAAIIAQTQRGSITGNLPGSSDYGPPEDPAAAALRLAAGVPARSRRELQQMDDSASAYASYGYRSGHERGPFIGEENPYDTNYGSEGMNFQGPNRGAMARGAGTIGSDSFDMTRANTGMQAYNASLQVADGYMQNIYQNAQKVANTSLAQAFGTTSGGIGGEIGGGLSADVAAMRQKIIAGDKGKGQKTLDADLAAFDANAKNALDNYKIATGQATPESIKFGDALATVDKAARAGKISTAEAANEYLTLAKAAQEGKTSVGDLAALMGTMTGTGGTTSVTHAGHGRIHGLEDASSGAGMKTAMLPFDDVKKGADDTITKVNALAQAMPDVGVQANAAAGVTVAANMRITGSYIIATGAALALAAAQRLVHP